MWNYRVIHHDKAPYSYFAVHEVFYDENGGVESWTAEPIDVSGENVKEVVKTLNMMLKDVTNQTVLKESELKKKQKKASRQ